MGDDIATAKEQIQGARKVIETLKRELAKLQDECNNAEVSIEATVSGSN